MTKTHHWWFWHNLQKPFRSTYNSLHCDHVKELRKRKGLKWAGSVVASKIPMPVDEEENEQFQMALRQSLKKQHIGKVVHGPET